MEIKTKFNVGDVLFTVKDMHIISFTVKIVSAFCDKDEKRISYIEDENLFASHKEEECFTSKEELLAFIQGK